MKAQEKSIILGVLSIVAASFLWSVNYLVLKDVAKDIGPFSVTLLEVASGTLAGSLIYRISPQSGFAAIKRGGWPIVLMGLLGVTLANSIFVFALGHIDLGVASIFEKTQPIFTVILAALFLKERLSFLSICFGLLGLIGSVEVIPLTERGATHPGVDSETAVGVVACVAAAISWAGAGVLGRKLAASDFGPVNMAFLRALVGTVTCLPFVLFLEWPHDWTHIPWRSIGLVCFAGVIDNTVTYVLYYQGMKYVAAGVTSIIEVITPVGAVFLGVLVLGEHLTLRQGLGALIVLVSVTALVGNEIRRHAQSTSSFEKHS